MVNISRNFCDALELVTDLEREVSKGCHHITLSEDMGAWSVHLRGDKGPSLNRVIAAFGFSDRPTTKTEDKAWSFTAYQGYRGRTRVTITEVEHKVRRVTG